MPKACKPKNPDSPLGSPGVRNPENTEKTSLKCHTFSLTLSPKDDITPVTIRDFCAYVQKRALHAFVCVEEGANGKRHLHSCLAFKTAIDRRNLHDYWAKRMVLEYEGSIGRYACLVTVMYNHKWYDEYLRKGGEIVYDNYDRDKVTELFPTMEQQAQLCEIKASSEVRVHVAYMLCDEWVEAEPSDSSYESAIRFIKHRMYVLRKPPLFIQERKLHEMCWCLYEMRNQLIEPTVADINYANHKTGNMSTI